jgi:hypothetical protein
MRDGRLALRSFRSGCAQSSLEKRRVQIDRIETAKPTIRYSLFARKKIQLLIWSVTVAGDILALS